MSHTAVQTNAFYPGYFRVEYSLDGTNWTAASNFTTVIESIELTRPKEQTHAGGSNIVPIVTVGKLDHVVVKVRTLYLDNDANAADRILYDRIRGSTPTVALRWKPRGDQNNVSVYATSNDGVTIGLVPVVRVTTPNLDPNEATPALWEIELAAPTVIRYLAGSSTGLGS